MPRQNELFEKSELPQTIQNMGLVLLKDWNEYFRYPTVGSMRQMIFHNKHNIRKAICKFGGRVYVKVPEFFNLFEQYSKDDD